MIVAVGTAQRRLRSKGAAGVAIGALTVSLAVACGDDESGSSDAGATETSAADGSTGVVAGDGGEVLGCPDGQTCDLVLVSQTLDDRVEIFSPEDPAGVVYRGAIDLDLKPNVCDGCDPGDNGDGRLDEPYGLALAGGHLHVVTGHYPMTTTGSLVSFPFDFFTDRPAGTTVPAADFFDGTSFTGATAQSLGELEPIFVTPVGDKLLLGVFNNDLFATEDTWTQPGRLAVIDADDPAGGFAIAELAALEGGACNGASEVITLDDGRVAVACDGNEAIAVLQIDALDGSPTDAAASVSGQLCSLPAGGTGGRRVRHLAPDGGGGFIVVDGPGPDVLADARLWWFDGECAMEGFITLDGSDWQLTQVVALPQAPATWLFGSGAASPAGNRGIYVAQGGGGEVTICGPLAGFESVLADDAGDPLEPLALAIDAEGTHLAVGTGPFVAPAAGPGFGRVGWATLAGADADPCAISATVTDLTAGPPGAPAVDPMDPLTFRRAPAVVEIVRVAG